MTTRLGVLSDVHHRVDARPDLSYHNPFDVAGVLGRLGAALDWFAQEQVATVVLDGDLSDLGDAASLEAVVDAVAQGWPGPALAVPGNHDVAERHDALARAVRRCGGGRVEMASREGDTLNGVRVVGVDFEAGGGLPPAAAWGDGLVVLVSHFPLLSRSHVYEQRGLKYAGDLPGREELLAGVLPRPRTVVVNGHLHGRDTHADGCLLQLSVAALVEPPFEATILDLDPAWDRPTVRRRARRIGEAAVAQEPVLAPPDETWAFAAQRWTRADS